MSCVEDWEAQGVDPLDAAMTVGCRVANPDAVGLVNGHDVIGVLVFMLSVVSLLFFAKSEGQI